VAATEEFEASTYRTQAKTNIDCTSELLANRRPNCLQRSLIWGCFV